MYSARLSEIPKIINWLEVSSIDPKDLSLKIGPKEFAVMTSRSAEGEILEKELELKSPINSKIDL